MIHCLLRLVSRNRQGEAVVDEREVVGASLRIGRGTDCAIHLPDPRVMFLHATVRPSDHGGFAVHGIGKDGQSGHGFESAVELPPGSQVMIGPYRIGAEPPRPGYDLVLAVELIHALPDERHALIARSRTALGQTALSMRWLALVPVVLIVAAFLAWPVLHARSPLPAQASAASGQVVTPDESWNPGPVSPAHRSFARECAQCHQQPFVRVQDSACQACHRDAGPHIKQAALQATAFGETRCAQCHLEHRQPHDLSPGNPKLCVDCHAGSLATHAGLPAISDFAKDHPPFKPKAERSNLRFPHEVHVARAGIASPAGEVKLQCASCHQASDGGLGFKPVSMQAHCADCHRLEFEPAITRRAVPHGDERVVMQTLREFYAQVSIGRTPVDVATVDGLLRRPGGTSDAARVQAAAWAAGKAEAVARDLFEVRSCSTCHEVRRQPQDAETPWRVAPVQINRSWLPRGRFPHAAHRSSDCSTCHDAASSRTSDDVDIPGIATCRGCHAGFQPARDKIASTCSSCHGFHSGGKLAAEDIRSASHAGGKP